MHVCCFFRESFYQVKSHVTSKPRCSCSVAIEWAGGPTCCIYSAKHDDAASWNVRLENPSVVGRRRPSFLEALFSVRGLASLMLRNAYAFLYARSVAAPANHVRIRSCVFPRARRASLGCSTLGLPIARLDRWPRRSLRLFHRKPPPPSSSMCGCAFPVRLLHAPCHPVVACRAAQVGRRAHVAVRSLAGA